MERDMEEYLIKKLLATPLTDRQKVVIEFTDNVIGREMKYICEAMSRMPDIQMKKSVMTGMILNIVSSLKTTDEMLGILEGCRKSIVSLDAEFIKNEKVV